MLEHKHRTFMTIGVPDLCEGGIFSAWHIHEQEAVRVC